MSNWVSKLSKAIHISENDQAECGMVHLHITILGQMWDTLTGDTFRMIITSNFWFKTADVNAAVCV